MRQQRHKEKSTTRTKLSPTGDPGYTRGFPLKVEDHPLAHQISLLTYKVLAKLVLTIRPLVYHLS